MNLGSWLWWLLWCFFLVIVLMMVFRILSDLFRRDDISGWGKAGWIIFILILPWLALLIYVITQGSKMTNRDMADAAQMRAASDDYIRTVTASSDPTAQIARAHDLLSTGALTQAEFDAIKAKALAG